MSPRFDFFKNNIERDIYITTTECSSYNIKTETHNGFLYQYATIIFGTIKSLGYNGSFSRVAKIDTYDSNRNELHQSMVSLSFLPPIQSNV